MTEPKTILAIIAIALLIAGLALLVIGVILDSRRTKAYGEESIWTQLREVFTKLFEVVFTGDFALGKRLMALGMMLIILAIFAGGVAGITAAAS